MKVAELKKYLDERFIKYPKNAKKDYLEKLVASLKTVGELNAEKRINIKDGHVFVAPQESVKFDVKDPILEAYTDKKGVTYKGVPEMPVTFAVPHIMTKEEAEALFFLNAKEKRLREEAKVTKQVEARAERKGITAEQARSQLEQLEVNLQHHPDIEAPLRDWKIKGYTRNEFKQEDELEDRILLEAARRDIEQESMEGAEAETRGYNRERQLLLNIIATGNQQKKNQAFEKLREYATARSLLLKPNRGFKLPPIKFVASKPYVPPPTPIPSPFEDEPDDSPVRPKFKNPIVKYEPPIQIATPKVPTPKPSPATPKTPKKVVVAPDKKEAASFQDDLTAEIKRKQEFKRDMAQLEEVKQQALVSSEITEEERAKIIKKIEREEQARIASQAKADEEAKKRAAQKAEEDKRKKLQQKTETKESQKEQEAEFVIKEKERTERKKEAAVVDKDKAALDARLNALFEDNTEAMEEAIKQRDEKLLETQKLIQKKERDAKAILKRNTTRFNKALDLLKAKKAESKNPKAVEKQITTLVEEQKQKVEDTQEALDLLREERSRVKQELSAQKKKKAEEGAKEKEARKKAINTIKAEEAKKALPELERQAEEEKQRIVAEVLKFQAELLAEEKFEERLKEELRKRGIVEEPPPPPPPPPKKKKGKKTDDDLRNEGGLEHAQFILKEINKLSKENKKFGDLVEDSGMKEFIQDKLKEKEGKLSVAVVDEIFDKAQKRGDATQLKKALQKPIIKRGFDTLKGQVKKHKDAELEKQKALEDLETETDSLNEMIQRSENILRRSQESTRKSQDFRRKSRESKDLLLSIPEKESIKEERPPTILERQPSRDVLRRPVVRSRENVRSKSQDDLALIEAENKQGLEDAKAAMRSVQSRTKEDEGFKFVVEQTGFRQKFKERINERKGKLTPEYVRSVYDELTEETTKLGKKLVAIEALTDRAEARNTKQGFDKFKKVINEIREKEEKESKTIDNAFQRAAEISTRVDNLARDDESIRALEPAFDKKFKAKLMKKGEANLTPEFVTKVGEKLIEELMGKKLKRDALLKAEKIVDRPAKAKAFEKLRGTKTIAPPVLDALLDVMTRLPDRVKMTRFEGQSLYKLFTDALANNDDQAMKKYAYLADKVLSGELEDFEEQEEKKRRYELHRPNEKVKIANAITDEREAREKKIRDREEEKAKIAREVAEERLARKNLASKNITKFISAVAKAKQLQRIKEREKAEESYRDEKTARDRALELQDRKEKDTAGIEKAKEFLESLNEAGKTNETIKALIPSFEKNFKKRLYDNRGNLSPDFVAGVFKALSAEMGKQSGQRKALLKVEQIVDRPVKSKAFEKFKKATKEIKEAQEALARVKRFDDEEVLEKEAPKPRPRPRPRSVSNVAETPTPTPRKPPTPRKDLSNLVEPEGTPRRRVGSEDVTTTPRTLKKAPTPRQDLSNLLEPSGTPRRRATSEDVTTTPRSRKPPPPKRTISKEETTRRQEKSRYEQKLEDEKNDKLNQEMRERYKAFLEEKKKQRDSAPPPPELKRRNTLEEEEQMLEDIRAAMADKGREKRRKLIAEVKAGLAKKKQEDEEKYRKIEERKEFLRLEKERDRAEREAERNAEKERKRQEKAEFLKQEKIKLDAIRAEARKAQRERKKREKAQKESIQADTDERIDKELEKAEEDISKITEEQKRLRIANYKAKVQAKKEEKAVEEAFKARQRQEEREKKKAELERKKRQFESEEDREQRKKWAEEASKEYLEQRDAKWLRIRERELKEAIARDEELERKGLKKRVIKERTELLKAQRAVEDELLRQEKAKAIKEGLADFAKRTLEAEKAKTRREKLEKVAERQRANAERVRQENEAAKRRKSLEDTATSPRTPKTPKTPKSPKVQRSADVVTKAPDIADVKTELVAYMKEVPMKYKALSLDGKEIGRDNKDVPLLALFMDALRGNRLKEAEKIADLTHSFWNMNKGKGIIQDFPNIKGLRGTI